MSEQQSAENDRRLCWCSTARVGDTTSHGGAHGDVIEHRAHPDECRAIPPA